MKVAFYHHPCIDGTTAAWIFGEKHLGAKLIPLDYGNMSVGDIVEKSRGNDVFFLDCSLKSAELSEVVKVAKSVTVIDHHISAKKELEIVAAYGGIQLLFDEHKCGAKLVWDWCHGTEYPTVVKYVDDRDRWVWGLPDSRAISAWISCFSNLRMHLNHIEWSLNNEFNKCAVAGQSILSSQQRMVEKLVEGARIVEFEGHYVKCVNTATLHSEVGEKLAELGNFGITWFQNYAGKFVYSLRSRGNFDVSVIAKTFGGGGHKNAAGFTLGTFLFL